MSSFKLNLLNGLLNSIASFHPEYATAIGAVIKYEPMLEKLGPVVTAGVKEGPGAVAALQHSAPELIAAVKALVAASPIGAGQKPGQVLPGPTQRAQDVHVENVTRSLFGFGGMTVEQQTAWMNSTTPGNDPSEENSTRGSG